MRESAMRTFTNERRPPGVSLMDRYPNLDIAMKRYRADAAYSIRLLNDAVTQPGAKLLVITEATSWLAPSSSF
ncbi:MAG: hypothetical protein ABW318_22510 [Vicinamibacterales bacterium]